MRLEQAMCNCRGFSLAVPAFAALAFSLWFGPASGDDPDATNAILANCVDEERASQRSGRDCIGKVAGPCKARPGNAHREDQMECDEREFVLWSQLLRREYRLLEEMLDGKRRSALRRSQSLWVRYQSDDCRVPYVLFSKDKAEFAGPACTIELKASRALQLRAWRDALKNL